MVSNQPFLTKTCRRANATSLGGWSVKRGTKLMLPGEVLVSPARLRALERLAVPHGARLRNQGITIREQPTRF